jgi:hypothetical protein
MAFPDPPESYWRRLSLLPETMYRAMLNLPEQGPYDPEQMERIRSLAAELDELLHWQVYNDAHGRTSYWLFLNHLSLKSAQARFAILAFTADPALNQGALAEAFQAYLQQVVRRRRQDDYVAAWLAEHPEMLAD